MLLNRKKEMNPLSSECLTAIYDRMELAGIEPRKDEAARRLMWAIEAFIVESKKQLDSVHIIS